VAQRAGCARQSKAKRPECLVKSAKGMMARVPKLSSMGWRTHTTAAVRHYQSRISACNILQIERVVVKRPASHYATKTKLRMQH